MVDQKNDNQFTRQVRDGPVMRWDRHTPTAFDGIAALVMGGARLVVDAGAAFVPVIGRMSGVAAMALAKRAAEAENRGVGKAPGAAGLTVPGELAAFDLNRFLITHYPQPSRRGTKQEHTGCLCGFERWRATRCNFKRGSARPSLLFFTEQRISAGRR
jgi:hypothetical protein